MRVTREEALSLSKQFAADVRKHGLAAVDPSRLLAQAAVATKMLTGTPAWDTFLQRVQAWIDDERASLNGMADTMLPNMSSEQVLMAHRHMACAKARIEAWEQILRLPNEILSTAEQNRPSSEQPTAA